MKYKVTQELDDGSTQVDTFEIDGPFANSLDAATAVNNATAALIKSNAVVTRTELVTDQ